jgi:hypothetical protein
VRCRLGDVCEITPNNRIFVGEYRNFGAPFYRGKAVLEKQAGKAVSNELLIEEQRYNEIKNRHGVSSPRVNWSMFTESFPSALRAKKMQDKGREA